MFIRVLTGALIVAALLGCSAPPHLVRIAVDPHHPPMEFLNDQKVLAGFDVELGQALATNRGWKVQWVQVPTNGLIRDVTWDGILAGLNRESFDLVISSVGVNSDRKRDWGLSTTYLSFGPALVVHRDRPLIPLAQWTGGTLGALAGSQAEAAIKRTPAARDWLRRYYDLEAALDDLVDGRVDGVVAEALDVAVAQSENERFAVWLGAPGPPLNEEVGYAEYIARAYAMATKKSNEGLLADVNAGLAALEADGTLPALRRKWHFNSP